MILSLKGTGIMKHFSRFASKGQGMVEYIILTALIALAVITMIALFGKQEKNQFAAMTQSLAGKTAVIDDQIAQQAAQEETVNPSMKKYGGDSSSSDSTVTGTDTESAHVPDSGNTASDPTSSPPPSPPATPPTPEPPPPPTPTPTVLTSTTSQAQRHHVGDGLFSPGLGGGFGINEGIAYTYNFTALTTSPVVTQKVDISFEVAGINYINNDIFLNGRKVGSLQDGVNALVLWGNDLQENNTLEIRASGDGTGYDDFEFWNFSVIRHDIQN